MDGSSNDVVVYMVAAVIVIGFVIKETVAYRMPASHWLNDVFCWLGEIGDGCEPRDRDCTTDAGSGCDGGD